MTEPPDRTTFCDKIGFGFAEDGRVVDLQFLRLNGKTAYIACEFDHLATIVTKIEEAIGIAWELQQKALSGIDPKAFFPVAAKKITSVQAARTKDALVLTFVASTGLRLNLSLEQTVIQEAIDSLEAAKASLGSTKRTEH